MPIKNVKLNLTDLELQKILMRTIYEYIRYGKSMIRMSWAALIIMFINISAYSFVIGFTGTERNIPYTMLLCVILFAAICAVYYSHKVLSVKLSILEAYFNFRTKDIRHDFLEYIPLIRDWRDGSYAKLIEYVLRMGEEAKVRYLNEGYCCFYDFGKTVTINFDERDWSNNTKIWDRCGENSTLLIQYNCIMLVDTEEESQ